MARESLKELGPATLSWSAILAGSFFALGAMVLLYSFGLAIGLSTLGSAPRGAGIWLAFWSLVVPIVALFGGGMITGRFSGVTNRNGGAVHSAVTWGFSTLLGVILVGVALTSVAGGLMSVGQTAATLTGTVASRVADVDLGQVGQAAGIDAQDLLQPVNQARAEQGLPPLQAENLQLALRDAVNTSLSQGRVDRQTLAGALARNTEITEVQAQQMAVDIEQRLQRTGADLTAAADQVLGTVATITWLTFLSSLLSLGAAVGGGMVAVSQTQKRPLLERQREIHAHAAPAPGAV